MLHRARIHRGLLAVTAAALLCPQILRGQVDPTPVKQSDSGSQLRSASLAISMGALEILSAAVLVQLSDRYSLGLVASAVALGGGLNGTWGAGLRSSYYFSPSGAGSFLWANAITVDCQYLLPNEDRTITWHNPVGFALEAVVGRDGIVGPGVGILWGVGLSMSFDRGAPPLFTPAIRLGLHCDI